MTESSFNQTIFNATLITPPDLYLTTDSPKIFFLGSGQDWKKKSIEHFTVGWMEDPIVMCYYDNDTTDENIPWIFYNIQNSDFLLFHLENLNNSLDLFLLGLLINRDNLFLSCDKNLKSICNLYTQFGHNSIQETPNNHLEILKRINNKKGA